MKETIFLYDKGTEKWGSTFLRGFNIANKLNCDITLFDENIKNKKIICLKPKDGYSKLLKLAEHNEIILDLSDFKYSKQKNFYEVFKQLDYAIFTSDKQKEKLMTSFKYPEKCVVIYHPWDERLGNVKIDDNSEIKIGYFGCKQKCHLLDEINEITYHVLQSNQESFTENLINYSKYNVHYIIKPENYEKELLPMTKLVNAAALSCPVITLKDGYDELLTDDYPFYCKSYDFKDIEKAIITIKSNFKNNAWYAALNILNLVKEKTSVNTILNEYNKIILAK